MIKFGAVLPTFQGASSRTHTIDFDGLESFALRAEELGYDSLWAADHLILGREGGMHEVWSIMSALALTTKRIRLGTLVLCNTHRSPALLTKMAATLDQLSGGRLDLGIGTGWYKTEQESYGLPWQDDVRARIAMFEEGLALMQGLFSGERVSFDGEFYSLDDAVSRPLPVQQPHPPIWIGASGERVMLRLVAQHADAWNIPALPVDEYAHKLDVIRRHCEAVGRDYDSIEKSMETRVMIFDDDSEMDNIARWFVEFQNSVEQAGDIQPSAETTDELRNQYILGNLEHCKSRIQQYVDIGVQHFQIYFIDYPSTHSLETFAREMFPLFK
ncbi:MAG: TIGR03560 family F420-dependent LLM class oxidoreductase [SAR202 cluster bacterium]|jgi:F420-dependent oxidoreductase-like protein|nr:TIGR03560 family F420-dependent LLM class oxidoreductase [SAR202 cluster bacterium]MDP6714913.1 TIGR03560 family F420-dependent LLM class oxidoreductase [SAR202 cluster bacterium]